MNRAVRLQTVSLALVAIAIVAGAAFTLLTPEIRCAANLDDCPPPAASPSGRVFVDTAPAAGEPYFIEKPRLPRPDRPTRVWLEPTAVVNPGRPVAVMLHGEGFQPEQIADIGWDQPDGGTYLGTATHVGRDGTFDVGLYWWPLQYAGIAGNDGRWPLRVTDRESGHVAIAALEVTSDDTTPPPDRWPSRSTWTPPPTGRPAVDVDVRGDLCHGDGARVEVTASGFPPDANIGFHHLRTDGQRIGFQNWQTDGYGRTEHIIDYFRLDDCDADRDFRFRIAVTAGDLTVEADVPLHATLGS